MKSEWIKPLIGRPGPFATVFFDATPAPSAAGVTEVEARWKSVRRTLEKQGAPAGVLDMLEDAALTPVSRAGAAGRVIIANAQGIHVDEVLRTRPGVPAGSWSTVPALVQAALAADEQITGLRVAVDRTGADFLVLGPGGWDQPISFEAPHDEDGARDADGARGGRRGAGRGEGDRGGDSADARVADTVRQNAEAIAREMERVAATERPELIALWGEPVMVAAVHSYLPRTVAQLVVEIPAGRRSTEVPASGPLREAVDQMLASYRAQRTGLVVDEYRSALARNLAVSGIEAVAAVLTRGQVKELVIDVAIGQDPALNYGDESVVKALQDTLWTGPDRLAACADPADLPDASGKLEKLPAAIALVRSAVSQDAGLTFVPSDALELYDGVGAILRWSDEATPADSAFAMTKDWQLAAKFDGLPR